MCLDPERKGSGKDMERKGHALQSGKDMERKGHALQGPLGPSGSGKDMHFKARWAPLGRILPVSRR